jgi:acyl-homoserine-lactone acylase
MHRTTGRRVGALLAVTALLVAACSGDDEEGASSATTTDGVIAVGSGDTYEATIRRDAAGVPHITADDMAGLSFGQGWASGEDRACDLADQVVKVQGERARWFGPGEEDANIESDLAWRNMGLADRAAEDWDAASDEVQQLITAYTDGWNAHLEEVGADGLGDWCAGEPWVRTLEPVEVYTYARSIALQASGNQLARYMGSAQPPATAEDTTDTGTTDDLGPEGDPTTSTTEDRPVQEQEQEQEQEGVDEAAAAVDLDAMVLEPVPTASNGWAIGAERSAEGGGMLVANPHFPWEGELRFWEVHLTIPGEVDIYGVQLSGLPGVGIGFTEDFGWTHTVSAGNRFTAYRLDLVPGEPTTYLYGDEERAMTSEDITIEVLGEDGELTEETRTMWSSHYGPVIDFPGFGWSETGTITYRDANIDNDEFIEQYLGMMQAADLDEFIAVHRDVTGVPLFNTIATSADGRAWYADTSATPLLSPEAIAAYQQSLETDPIVAVAAESRAVLLDGSDPVYEWQDAPGARDPGLVPFDAMPAVERDDYVFNANDSFWMPHATELLEGDYSPLHGWQGTPRSPRTRENAVVLDEGGTFTLDQLADAAVANRGFMARSLLDDVVARCEGAGTVRSDPLDRGQADAGTPPGEVDVTEACAVLAEWDGVYDLDRAGPPLWREFLAGFDDIALTEVGPLWAEPFDADDPLGTPSGLAPPLDGGRDPVLANLARAVLVLDEAGVELDATLGEVQFADRNGTIVPIHGGEGRDGVTNVVGWGTGWSTLDPALRDRERTPYVAGSSLADLDGTTGYPINNGTSFLMALAYTDAGPRAKAFLTYGNPGDGESPLFTEATEAFSDKAWRTVAFTEEDVAEATVSTTTVRG